MRQQTSAHMYVPPGTCPHRHRKPTRRVRPVALRPNLGPTALRAHPTSGFDAYVGNFLYAFSHKQLKTYKTWLKLFKKYIVFIFLDRCRAVVSKFWLVSSYIHTPSTVDIDTGPHGACVDEVVLQGRWGAPVNRDEPGATVFVFFLIYMPARGRFAGAENFRDMNTNHNQRRVEAKRGFGAE